MRRIFFGILKNILFKFLFFYALSKMHLILNKLMQDHLQWPANQNFKSLYNKEPWYFTKTPRSRCSMARCTITGHLHLHLYPLFKLTRQNALWYLIFYLTNQVVPYLQWHANQNPRSLYSITSY